MTSIEMAIMVVAADIHTSMIDVCMDTDIHMLGVEPLTYEEFRVVGEAHMMSHKVDVLIKGMEEAMDRMHEGADQREALRKIPAFSRVCLDE